MEKKMETTIAMISYKGYIGIIMIMEKEMETTIAIILCKGYIGIV